MNQTPFQYSVHTLSDGSEYTNPVILLTAERGTTSLTRYALTGLTSMSARLGADQRVPLHSIRVCFTSNTSGLASLLLALSQAGVAELVICGSVSHDSIDAIARLVLGSKRSYPFVRTCQVPNDGAWYQVYQDEHIRAYGKLIGEQLVWVYTLLQSNPGSISGSQTMSFAWIPANVKENLLEPLPEDVSSKLECVFFEQRADHSILANKFFFLCPTSADDRLLHRANRQAYQLSAALPFAISFRSSNMGQQKHQRPEQHNDKQLTSGSRLCLRNWTITEAFRADVPCDNSIDQAGLSKLCENDASREKLLIRDKMLVKELASIWGGNALPDENEIDIDDENDSQGEMNDEPHSVPLVPHLLVLGTGCASPSASRGSSGYAIFTPQIDQTSSMLSLTALLDCGEGTLTNLHRHLPSNLFPLNSQLSRIKFIWISHAHLDHYGGLPDVLIAIHAVRSSAFSARCDNHNCIKSNKKLKITQNHEQIPIVIAPSKVLSFLRASLQNQHLPGELYRGMTHRKMESSLLTHEMRELVASVGAIRSIPVDHCAHAYALHLEFSLNNFGFVYSGDTRPSDNLIRAVSGTSVSLLLHEATFDDDPRGVKEALGKRHSTVSEALNVAQQIQPKACLLTHFSQRYPKSPPGWIDVQDESTLICFAVDGMWLPLTDAVMVKLPVLSQMMQRILNVE